MDSFVTTVRKDVKDFATLSPQVRFLLAIQLIILFILSILIGVIFSPKFKKSVTHQNNIVLEKPIEGVTLTILPQDEFMKIGEETPFFVTMSGAAPYAMDVVVTYDPALLQVSQVENGDIFDRVILNTVKPGAVTFSAAYNPGKNTFKKEGTVLKFKAKALKKTEQTLIYFDQKQTIAAQEGKNILNTLEPAQVHIFD